MPSPSKFSLICTCLMLLSLTSFSNGFQPLFTSPLISSASSAGLTKLQMAGFGGDSKSSKKRNNKKAVPIKLKPKLQWDRYTALKGEKKFIVGIRDSSDEASEWMEVGKIKSKDHSKTEIAVAMQRGIIAEHGKRLYPLQVSKKMICEWGYLENDKWKVVDVKIATFASEGFEKKIGFAGKPDLATGFYCVYDNGKIKLGEETSFT